MSSIFEIVLRATLVLLVLVLLPGLPWPDITTFLPYFEQLFKMLWLLNPVFDVPTLFAIGKIILFLELIFIARRFIMSIIHFVTSGTFYTEIRIPPGEGGIGSGRTGI